MKKETLTEELMLQKEVIEFLRCASSSFFTAERYEWLRKKVIKDAGGEMGGYSDGKQFNGSAGYALRGPSHAARTPWHPPYSLRYCLPDVR